jgi:hypothetical protein
VASYSIGEMNAALIFVRTNIYVGIPARMRTFLRATVEKACATDGEYRAKW